MTKQFYRAVKCARKLVSRSIGRGFMYATGLEWVERAYGTTAPPPRICDTSASLAGLGILGVFTTAAGGCIMMGAGSAWGQLDMVETGGSVLLSGTAGSIGSSLAAMNLYSLYKAGERRYQLDQLREERALKDRRLILK
jgi:hypothetical protein